MDLCLNPAKSIPLPRNSPPTPPDLPILARINLPWLSSQVPSAWNTSKCLVVCAGNHVCLTPSYSSHTPPPPSLPAPPFTEADPDHHSSFTQNPGDNSTQCSTTSPTPHPHPSNNSSKGPAGESCSPHERPIANLPQDNNETSKNTFPQTPPLDPPTHCSLVHHQEQTQQVPDNIESVHNLNSRTPPPDHLTFTPIPEKVHPPKLAPLPTGIKPNPATPSTMMQDSEIDANPQLQNPLPGSVRNPRLTWPSPLPTNEGAPTPLT
ncbi:hypothetical protein E4T56_gene366 [Termitomyces sp. T112]|nr:hypothetical protein E4T56_gene366 [Termitomyces sp. T112]